ncbi:MAG TPA: DUF4233 domain-containing protein [Pseudonocardiaceae bacterium]
MSTPPSEPTAREPAAGPGSGATAEPGAAPGAPASAGPPDAAAATPGRGRDPWKGLRGIMAATLILEFITVLLALPVVARLGGGLSGPGGWAVGVLATLMLLAAFVQRRPWGLPVALGLQVAMIACWPLVPALGALGVIFGLVWLYLLHLRRNLRRHLASSAGSS